MRQKLEILQNDVTEEGTSSLVSISPIFYKQLFYMKAFCAIFMCSKFGFVIFWLKDIGAKAAHKMLVKLTPGRRQKLL
jgi:hypothetical protein